MTANKGISLKGAFAAACVCVLATFLIGALPASTDSYVYNENGRLAAGLASVRNQDYSLFNVNPPLSNVVGALPAAFTPGFYTPTRYDYGFDPFERHEYKAGEILLEKNPRHWRYFVAGRFCVLLFSAFGLLVVFLYASWLFGRAGGAVAGVMWLFSPYIVGHGAHIGADVPSAAMGLAAVAAFHYALARKSDNWLFASGILLGLAQLTKFTLIILYPLLFALWLLYRRGERRTPGLKGALPEIARVLILNFLMSLVVLNAGYLCKGTFTPLGNYRFQSALLSGNAPSETGANTPGSRFKGTLLGYLPVPLPKDYVAGIDVQRVDFEKGLYGRSYLCGRWGSHGWFRYYFFALLIKTPPGFLALFALAVLLAATRPEYRLSHRDELFVWTPGLALLLFVSSQTGFSVHSRYIIPALPFFFVAAGRVGQVFAPQDAACVTRSRRLLKAFAAASAAGGVLSAALVYPHELSYFNLLTTILPSNARELPAVAASTPAEKARALALKSSVEGPRFLLASNADWGQDARRLDQYLQRRPDIDSLYVDLVTSSPIRELSVPARFYQPRLTVGWYAISVDSLYYRRETYADFFKLRPVKIIGTTIYLFYINEKDAEWATIRRDEEK